VHGALVAASARWKAASHGEARHGDCILPLISGEPVLHVIARFSASTGFSTSKVRSICYNGSGESNKHNANYLLSATENPALLYAAQAFSYANFALSRSQLGNLMRSLWGKTVGTTWARVWVARHRNDVSARTSKALSDKRNAASTFGEVKEWVSELGSFDKKSGCPLGRFSTTMSAGS